jgi:hypothetical protein
MVEAGYPMVWTPGQVEFIDLQTLGSIIVQRVEVIDQAGTAHYLGYQMIRDGKRLAHQRRADPARAAGRGLIHRP